MDALFTLPKEGAASTRPAALDSYFPEIGDPFAVPVPQTTITFSAAHHTGYLTGPSPDAALPEDSAVHDLTMLESPIIRH